MIKEYWYWYECAPSSETRGRRPTHDGGCGHWNVMASSTLLDGRQTIQASPCENCHRRRRLNRGNASMADWEYKTRFNPLARKNQASEEAASLNYRLSKSREEEE
jgi:hypothetical protein